MRRGLLWAFAVSFLAQILPATTVGVYLNQADWQAAMSLHGANPLTDIGFNNSQWTDTLQLSSTYTARISRSSGAASNGMAVSATSGYGAPGFADNSTLGHVSNGFWSDTISKYGSTTFQFSDSIYGFGGDFNIAGGNGLFIGGAGNVPYPYYTGSSPFFAYPGYNGFIGIISAQPMDSVLISWGQNGTGYSPFGNSYTLTNLQVATVATPEPNYIWLVPAFLVFVLGYARLRRT